MDRRLNQRREAPLPDIMRAKNKPLDETDELAAPVVAPLDAMQVSEIVEVVSPDTFKRPDLCRQRQPDRAVH